MMRILLLALMIALLPVRGWMGNAMAVDMAAQAVSKAQQAGSALPAGTAADAEALMPADCPMLTQSPDHAASGVDAPAGGIHCNACDTCELCLALATSTWPALLAAASTPNAEPVAAGYRFSSAERFTSLKPPIS